MVCVSSTLAQLVGGKRGARFRPDRLKTRWGQDHRPDPLGEASLPATYHEELWVRL